MEPSDPRLALWKGPGRERSLVSVGLRLRLYITYGERFRDWELPMAVVGDRDWPCKYFTIIQIIFKQ